MKKITLLILFASIFISCGKRETRSLIADGDYDSAISNAANALHNRKDAKGKQDYIYMLEEAFAKAKERDERNITQWFKDANPQNLEKIYDTYVRLNSRQEIIRPLLPLKLIKEKRDAKFPFTDYSDQIVSSKNALAKYLYDNSLALLGTKNKDNARRAFDDLNYLNTLSPGFKDVQKNIDKAKFMGTDFILVSAVNQTNVIIPRQLENDLLDFSTYGLNDKWTAYHSVRQKGVDYDFGITVSFRQILISPEQVKEKEFSRERDIVTGTKKKLDRDGHVVKDSLGNPVLIDIIKKVGIRVNEFRQVKSAKVTAQVDYVALPGQNLIQTFPLASEFVFENFYASYRGDKRAIEEAYWPNFNNRPVPFPSNEQMVYDTGEDLKAKLKDIIVRNKVRR